MAIRGIFQPPIFAGVGVALSLILSGSGARAQQPLEAPADQTYPAPSEPPPGYGPPPAAPQQGQDAWGAQPDYGQAGQDSQDPQDPNAGAPLIPPNVEGAPYQAAEGGYCYVGPHPVDTRVVPGYSWDDTQGQHFRPYAPVDTRLFSFRDGCYYFIGDPRDFGYAGQTNAYYGAHPILDVYGGGWCFMMGPHTHLWRPWSPYFTVVGAWNYWYGPFDPFFWAYWPYYSFYYRSYYPSYYGGGRFYRGGGFRVAPPIRSVPASAWRGAPMRGAPAVRGAAPGAAAVHGAPTVGGAYRGGGYAAPAPAARPSFPAARPSYSAPPVRSVAPSSGGSFHGGGGTFRSGGGFRGGRR